MLQYRFSWTVLTWCLFSLVVAASQETDNGILRIPLMRMESGLQKLLRQGADIKLIEGIYDMARRASKPPRLMSLQGKPSPVPPSNDTLPLYKYFDTEYYGLINIGKPGKTFKMVMDTAWGFTWVPSKDCPMTRLPCAVHERYNHDQSSTYVRDGRAFNISGQYIGTMSKDTFLVGHLKAANQSFAELTQLPWMYTLFTSDGTIGLGLQDLSPGYTPFFYTFYNQNKLNSSIFSFYVNRDPTTKHGGSVFFGGIDTKHNKTEFTTVDIISKYYWQFKMDKVTVVMSKKSSQDFCKNGCIATADTSSNTIVGPADEIKQINRLIGAADRIFFSNRYLIPCANEFKGPKVKFTIGNQQFQILARDYIQKLSYSGVTVCLSAFQPCEPDFPVNTWTLGGAFLYQFYTAFDINNRKMMIAEAA